MALIKESRVSSVKIRRDLMDPNFSSIWIEYKAKNKKQTLISGFYREWSHNGSNSEESQLLGLDIFTLQIESATKQNKNVILMGDANLCSLKWETPKYKHKNIAKKLLDTLAQCGLSTAEIGITYLADHAQRNGNIAESALDHVYFSNSLTHNKVVKKGSNCSSDHLPETVILTDQVSDERMAYTKKIVKRSFKNFTNTKWNEALEKKDWSKIKHSRNLDEMVVIFTELSNEALDEVAPYKEFTVRSKHRFGLSEETKLLMEKRNEARLAVSKVNGNQKVIWLQKYKKLRNQVNNKIRKDTVDFNNKRVDEAKDENEIWNIAKDITNPKKETEWSLKMENGVITDKQQIADHFNKFFVEKIQKLKDNIDNEYVEDPLERLSQKTKQKRSKFSLKQINEKGLLLALKKIKNKKSTGSDGLSQEHLKAGSRSFKGPLTKIFNLSIRKGEFPKGWKEAMVTPVHKKGDKECLENYRPVSCLPAAAKLLERVVCTQTSDFMEKNNLLPTNQHGFRAHRSTMTAWADIQQEWAINSEKKNLTGVLLWDLSAAFDCLDNEILCGKLKLYGFDDLAVTWFKSFLTNRTQIVKIGNCLSSPVNLTSGVPQGGILSPLLYIIYVADIQDWLEFASAITYADDTSTSVSHADLNEVKRRLEIDAVNILKFMASNGLVANPKKTSLMFLGTNKLATKESESLKIGKETVIQEFHVKLLGITIDSNQRWESQIIGSGGVISALNSRLFTIKRLQKALSLDRLRKITDSIFTSKIRYGLQLYGNVRLEENDPKNALISAIQLTQNKMARFLNGTKIKDRIRTEQILDSLKMLSVNRLNAQIKLMEVWKSLNDVNYPTIWPIKAEKLDIMKTRSAGTQKLIESGSSKLAKGTFINDAAKIWNRAPDSIKYAKSLSIAKKEIKIFVAKIPL